MHGHREIARSCSYCCSLFLPGKEQHLLHAQCWSRWKEAKGSPPDLDAHSIELEVLALELLHLIVNVRLGLQSSALLLMALCCLGMIGKWLQSSAQQSSRIKLCTAPERRPSGEAPADSAPGHCACSPCALGLC